MPPPNRFAQRLNSWAGVSAGDQDDPIRPARRGRQGIGAEERRERSELLGRLPGRFDPPPGDGHLDEGGQEPRALHPIIRYIGQSALELAEAGLGLPVGKPEQSEAWLWLNTGFERMPE